MLELKESLKALALAKPDEVRTFEKGKVEIFNLGGAVIGRATFEPGWRWSTCVKPIAKTDYCEAAHVGYQLSGTMHVELRDGQSLELKKGDFFSLPAGHDGWVIGDEPVVSLDFQGMVDYAKPKERLERPEQRETRKH
jgi:hypothetical protein